MHPRSLPFTAIRGLAALTLLAPAHVSARQANTSQGDTITHRLEALIVTAERRSRSIARSTHAASTLTREQVLATPARTLADALARVPGIAFVDFDGMGGDPQLIMRGFYGGGEAEYALLLVDGRPVNRLESARIVWDAIPLAAVERIEIVRGAGSTAWGDAAMGGVINVITRTRSPGGLATLAAGSNGALDGSIDVSTRWRERPVSLFAHVMTIDGYRAHAERTTGTVGAAATIAESDAGSFRVSTMHDWRDFDVPGPLTEATVAASRRQSSPFYRFDKVSDRRHRVQLEGQWSAGTAQWSASLSGELRHDDQIRTVPLAPTFADTKNRVIDATRAGGSVQAEWTDVVAADDGLLIGIDASAGRLESTYYDFVTGPIHAYAEPASRGDLHADGTGHRMMGAAFVDYELMPTAIVRVTAGARVDWLRDAFDATSPETSSTDATHVAFSPRVGVNVGYVESDRHTGNVYASLSRSFKAPTLDQLFDQRRFPAPFPPFEIGFANAELDPQYGTSVEVGAYHRATLAPNTLTAELSVAVYQLDLKDELDFDLETFRYQNIGRSRHRGLEAGVDLYATAGLRAFARYTHQAATRRSGENEGRQLKAIPRHAAVFGIHAGDNAGPSVAVQTNRAWGTHLDDANTIELPAWTRFDARLAWGLLGFSVWVQARNLFDERYSTTGFPDSADPETVYYFPAAGRTFEVGLRRAW